MFPDWFTYNYHKHLNDGDFNPYRGYQSPAHAAFNSLIPAKTERPATPVQLPTDHEVIEHPLQVTDEAALRGWYAYEAEESRRRFVADRAGHLVTPPAETDC